MTKTKIQKNNKLKISNNNVYALSLLLLLNFDMDIPIHCKIKYLTTNEFVFIKVDTK